MTYRWCEKCKMLTGYYRSYMDKSVICLACDVIDAADTHSVEIIPYAQEMEYIANAMIKRHNQTLRQQQQV